MSTMSTQFASHGRGQILAVVGESVTFGDVSAGTTTAITAVMTEKEAASLREIGMSWKGESNLLRASFSKADVAAPELGDTLTFSSKVWAIVELSEHNGMWHANCVMPNLVS